MDAQQFFLISYEHLRRETTRLGELSDEQWRARPQGMNSIAWLVWHLARFEDAALHHLVTCGTEVFDDCAAWWPERLRVARRDLGVGMTDAEVDELTAAIDCDTLRAYSEAVAERTRAIVRALPPATLDEVLEPGYLARLLTEGGMVAPAGREVVGRFFSTPRSRGFYLSYFSLQHYAGHLYDTRAVKSLLGFRGG